MTKARPETAVPRRAILLACALSLAACKSREGAAEGPPPPAAPAPAAAVPPAAVAPAAPPSGAMPGVSSPECIAPYSADGEPATAKFAGRTWERRGARLTAQGAAPERAVFGVVANLKEPTGENLLNLRRYVEFFKAEKADAIMVPGDSGESAEDIAAVLRPLAATGLPVLVIPGNRESRAEFRAAMDALGKKFPNVVDMTRVRLAELGAASVVSLPGYYDRRFIHAGDDGCQYFQQDVEQLKAIVAAAKQPVVLMAHAEPLGRGKEAIDAFQDGNAGDGKLRELLAEQPVPFGVFANIQEAGGRAADLDGLPVPAGTERPKLFLNPGLADSTPWKLNDGSWSYGMAAVLAVQGPSASYKVFRARQFDEKDQAEATRLQAGR